MQLIYSSHRGEQERSPKALTFPFLACYKQSISTQQPCVQAQEEQGSSRRPAPVHSSIYTEEACTSGSFYPPKSNQFQMLHQQHTARWCWQQSPLCKPTGQRKDPHKHSPPEHIKVLCYSDFHFIMSDPGNKSWHHSTVQQLQHFNQLHPASLGLLPCTEHRLCFLLSRQPGGEMPCILQGGPGATAQTQRPSRVWWCTLLISIFFWLKQLISYTPCAPAGRQCLT